MISPIDCGPNSGQSAFILKIPQIYLQYYLDLVLQIQVFVVSPPNSHLIFTASRASWRGERPPAAPQRPGSVVPAARPSARATPSRRTSHDLRWKDKRTETSKGSEA